MVTTSIKKTAISNTIIILIYSNDKDLFDQIIKIWTRKMIKSKMNESIKLGF
jgi:hypothetical protein